MSAAATPFIYFIRFLRLALGGFLILGVSQLTVDHQKEFEVRKVEAIAYFEQLLANGIQTIPSDHAGLAYEGEFVHIQGVLDTGTLTDPLTGMTLYAGQGPTFRKATGLRRTVEMLQWHEEITGTSSLRESKFTTRWSEKLIDSDRFHSRDLLKGQLHNNPKQLPHETGIWFEMSQLMLGAWPLELSYTHGLDYENPVRPDLMNTVADGWQVVDGLQVSIPSVMPTGQATDLAVGAFRILYAGRTIPYGDSDGQYSAIGLVKDGTLIHPYFGVHWFGLPLLTPGNVSADILLEQALDKLHEDPLPPRIWNFYVFVGWLLCIGVLARFFPNLQRFTEASCPRRAVITIIIAAIGTALIGSFL